MYDIDSIPVDFANVPVNVTDEAVVCANKSISHDAVIVVDCHHEYIGL
ncbi:hypothetical protein J5751_03860 [bacterium]|nr:hypothetical protein [bacterium]